MTFSLPCCLHPYATPRRSLTFLSALCANFWTILILHAHSYAKVIHSIGALRTFSILHELFLISSREVKRPALHQSNQFDKGYWHKVSWPMTGTTQHLASLSMAPQTFLKLLTSLGAVWAAAMC